MTDQSLSDRIVDAEQAKQAMDRWLGPAFDVVLQSYQNAMVQLASNEPWADKKITKVAIAFKIATEVRKQIEAVVSDGKVARHELNYGKQIAELPAEQRRWIGL
jgi:hypothetical protein